MTARERYAIEDFFPDEIAALQQRAVRAALDDLERAVEGLPYVPDEDVADWDWLSRSDVLALITEARERVKG